MSAILREIVLSRRQAGALCRLLASYREDLESLILESIIESHTIDGDVMPGAYDDAAVEAEARRQWREADDLVMVVEQQLCSRCSS